MPGIEYIAEDLSTHPECAHGPTLLFSRPINRKGTRRSFFVCSACRDRKLCSFFLWQDERDEIPENRRVLWEMERQLLIPNIDHRQKFLQLTEIQEVREGQRNYCVECKILLPEDKLVEHIEHSVKVGVLNKELANPSKFLSPLSNDKKEAQYFFSDGTVKTVIRFLEALKLKNILCIGAPRIHAQIQSKLVHMTSLLLDLDHRYHDFYGPLQFGWYNLFNHHFFFRTAKEVFADFLQTDMGEGVAVIMDPPFGGRIEPMAQSLRKIQEQYQSLNETTDQVPVFLFMPYFMEPQIINSLPEYAMADYKVDYDNHRLFRDKNVDTNYGSPVRMFTNVPLSDISLSENEGYRHCLPCKRWVYKQNKHCKFCKACTSKDGRTYVHCKICERCVKPTWKHCSECNKCAQVEHTCEEVPFNQPCFHCKERGHKQKDCPVLKAKTQKRKMPDSRRKGKGANKKK